MSHTIVRELKFVSLSGRHAGLVCELALAASSNMLDLKGKHVFKWSCGSISNSLDVARALAAKDVACGYLRNARGGASTNFIRLPAVSQDSLDGAQSVAVALLIRALEAKEVEVHTKADVEPPCAQLEMSFAA